MKLVHLDGFIIKKFVTMHGHVNVKKNLPTLTRVMTFIDTIQNPWGGLGSVVVKALRYKSEGRGIDSRCRRGFFPWHLTLKLSTRIILGVKAAGA